MACGMCCFARYEGHVPLTGADHARLNLREQDRYTEWLENTVFMKMVDGHCVALDISDEGYMCRIYERRPEICRAFERGGEECDAVRHQRMPDVGREAPPE